MPSEFELIARHFTRPTRHSVLGVGDDAAILRPSAGMELLVSTDMLVAGTHFLADADPEALGWKALAVNVSDIAAMGGQPRWALLALALPAATESWLAHFAAGLFACADAYGIDLVGGDTTRGPRNICVTILGEAPQGQALRRAGARPGDQIWVSGAPGLAALGLLQRQGKVSLRAAALPACAAALDRPRPRVALGLALRGLATAAIDVSDGLLADLGHILEESGRAAHLELERLPRAALETGADEATARDALLSGGDDYELLFTVPAARQAEIEALGGSFQLALTRIGTITEGRAGEIALRDCQGRAVETARRGYDHFA